LATEIKGTGKAWSKTKKDLWKTRWKNKIIMEENIYKIISKNIFKSLGT
jgi:hypothetical protein